MNKTHPDPRCTNQWIVKYAFKEQRNSKRYICVGDQVKHYVML